MKSYLRKVFIGSLFLLFVNFAFACPFCDPQIKEAIYNNKFYPNLITMLSAFIVLAAVVMLLTYFNAKRYKLFAANNPSTNHLSPVPLTTTAMVLGIGIGGFIDGIVLHQILQWHEMLSNKIPPTNYVGKSVNMFWDGIFHAFTLMVTFTGIILLWKLLHRNNFNRSGYLLGGGLLVGWGLFNLIEGIIDHQILKLHNVKEVSLNPEIWNYIFLGFSVSVLIAGYVLIEKADADKAANRE
ncbi:MAG TPA: DUF2243 domain-containing protein [Flavisolibacter sp.]|nr:DUF2243 domain-containing protein [Flavisolibacter sp.]